MFPPIYLWKTASSTNRQGNANRQHQKFYFGGFLDVGSTEILVQDGFSTVAFVRYKGNLYFISRLPIRQALASGNGNRFYTRLLHDPRTIPVPARYYICHLPQPPGFLLIQTFKGAQAWEFFARVFCTKRTHLGMWLRVWGKKSNFLSNDPCFR